MKITYAVVAVLLLVNAASASEHLLRVIDPDVQPATRLARAEAVKDEECSHSKCDNSALYLSGSGGGDFGLGGGAGGGEGQGPSMSIMDALAPIDEWIKAFRRRASGGQNLYRAAKATVAPLIKKLKRTQENAQDKLVQSNDAIIQHVEESVTNHIYNLLRSTRKKQQVEQRKEDQEEELKEEEQQDKERKELRDALKKAMESEGGDDKAAEKEVEQKASEEVKAAKDAAAKDQQKKF